MTKSAVNNETVSVSKKQQSWIYRLYQKTLDNADSPKAFWMFLGVSFAESSFFPFPPDLMMIPMVVAKRSLAWRLAFWGMIASVIGGIAGYFIGSFLYDTLGQWLIDLYHLQAGAEKFHDGYNKWGFWIIILKGITPVPYKIVTIASGMAHYPFWSFVGASVIVRSFRFFLLAALLWKFGALAKQLMDRYLGWCLAASFALIIVGFILVKLISG
jgi:membrane protein YqaA with SNARE-associated domain